MDVGDRLTRERFRQALSDAEIDLGLALFDEEDEDCTHLFNAVLKHFGPDAELVKIRKLLGKTIDVKGSLWLIPFCT